MLINAVVETSKRYNKVNQERVEYKKLISESKTIKRQFDEVQQSYLELQEANLIQSKYIDKIQKQLAKVFSFLFCFILLYSIQVYFLNLKYYLG